MFKGVGMIRKSEREQAIPSASSAVVPTLLVPTLMIYSHVSFVFPSHDALSPAQLAYAILNYSSRCYLPVITLHGSAEAQETLCLVSAMTKC